jgi:drug/metabolite transporter (DMT)-like permease
MGNGAVMWAQKTVPSGVVALIVSTVPIWIVLLDWVRPRGVRPRNAVFFGLALGLVGTVILIGPRAIIGQGHVDEIGALVLVIGSLGWALGTIVTRTTKRSASLLVFSSLQMIAAAAAMLVTSIALREPASFSISDLSMRSALSWVYLVFAGSIIGYTAYIYLLQMVSAAKAATYAYVNPVIAVVLGWAFANEPIGLRTVIAAAVILAGVAIITSTHGTSQPTGEYPVPSEAKEQERSAA